MHQIRRIKLPWIAKAKRVMHSVSSWLYANSMVSWEVIREPNLLEIKTLATVLLVLEICIQSLNTPRLNGPMARKIERDESDRWEYAPRHCKRVGSTPSEK